jgi:hypothetical protein
MDHSTSEDLWAQKTVTHYDACVLGQCGAETQQITQVWSLLSKSLQGEKVRRRTAKGPRQLQRRACFEKVVQREMSKEDFIS